MATDQPRPPDLGPKRPLTDAVWDKLKVHQEPPPPLSPLDTDAIINIHIPFWLLVGGGCIELFAVAMRPGSYFTALIYAAGQFAALLALVAVSVTVGWWIRRFPLGPRGAAYYKLAAIAMAITAFGDLTAPLLRNLPTPRLFTFFAVPLALIVGLGGMFGIFFTLLRVFFDLDESDAKYCVSIMFVVAIGAHLLLLWGGWLQR